MPACSEASVTSISRWASGVMSPTPMVNAASPCQPSTMAPQSIEMMSPSRSGRSSGMPCTIMLFGEAQITAGKPW